MNAKKITWGVASVPIPGEVESGDQYMVDLLPEGALVAVVDGLGHGEEAAASAKKAIATLEKNHDESVISLVYRCNDALKGLRGAVMSLAGFNTNDDTVTWLGVGNVEGVLLRANPEVIPNLEHLLVRRGVVGERLPVVRASILPLMPGDTLIVATDGIRSGFEAGLPLKSTPQQLADTIFKQHAAGNDDALVLVVRYGEAGT